MKNGFGKIVLYLLSEAPQKQHRPLNEETGWEPGDSIGGRTRLQADAGNPVEHTLSPLIHHALARTTKKRYGICAFFCRRGRQLGDAVKGDYALNVWG